MTLTKEQIGMIEDLISAELEVLEECIRDGAECENTIKQWEEIQEILAKEGKK